MGYHPQSLKKRDIEKLQFFDDFNADEKLQDRERLFEEDVFKANADGITTQLKNRFESTPIDADLREQILKLGPYQPEGNFHHLIKVSYPRQDKRSKGNGCAIQHDFVLLTVRKKLVWLKNGVSPPEFEKKKRDIEKLQFFDDFNADEKLQDRERLFEEDVFKANADAITTQLKNRFESMNDIYKSFSFLSPKNILSTTNDLLYKEAGNLQKNYHTHLEEQYANYRKPPDGADSTSKGREYIRNGEGYIRNGGKEVKLFTSALKAFQCNNRIVMAQRKHLDDFLRGRVIGRLECGRTQLEVSEELGIAQSVISRLWQRFQDDGNVSRCYSTGRPRVTTPNEGRYIWQLLPKETDGA
ncbi:acyl-CoA synthetase family member 2, mitochondrial [Trichonephila clavipes]|nr:acyl-CoA synthetase family member 2, mitochondrial [Trichonephila clavipes]